MGQITTGTGLISGLDIAGIVDQLIEIESRPKQLVEEDNKILEQERVAFQTVNASLLALDLSVQDMARASTFTATSATSSDDSILAVSSNASAATGSFNFVVKQLVSAQQSISRGFTDYQNDPVIAGGGSITIESDRARLDSRTRLDELNGGEGVRRGLVRITDRAGGTGVVDLSNAISIDDVLDAINNHSSIRVNATVDGDALKLTDLSGGAGNLAVSDVGTTGTATALGLAGTVAGDVLTGSAVRQAAGGSFLTELNDGNGVRVKSGLDDFRITDGTGTAYNVNLDGAATLDEVIDAIDAATGGVVTASLGADGASLQLTDTTGGGASFAVTALNGSGAAADLALLGSDDDADGTIAGGRLVAGINDKLLRFLKGGTGGSLGEGTIRLTDRSGATADLDLTAADLDASDPGSPLTRVQTIGQLVTAINNAGTGIRAQLNETGNGLVLTDTAVGGGSMLVSDVSGTTAADLNLAGDHTAAGIVDSGDLDYQYITEATRLTDLGVSRGTFRITDSSGVSGTIDLTQGNEVTLADVIGEINSRGLAIHARINDTGDGLLIEDTGPGTTAITIEDQGGTTARDLGLRGTADNPGDDLDGSFETVIDVAADDTLEDLAQKITDAGAGVRASVINDGSSGNPYRLSISSRDGGSLNGFVVDTGGSGLDLGLSNLSEARDAVVFYGGGAGRDSVVITSKTNSLQNIIPGTTIDLKRASTSSVSVTVEKDTEAVTSAVSKFVSDFNRLMDAMDKYDFYDADNQQRGLLLNDSTFSNLRSRLYNSLIARSPDLGGQYTSLTSIGIRVGSGATVSFDQDKFLAAFEQDPDAVTSLFSLEESVTDEDTGETQVTARGVGVMIRDVLESLTDSEFGLIEARLDRIDSQLELNNDRIANLDAQLERKRQQLMNEFIAMERALAEMQNASSALAGIAPVSVPNSNGGN